MEEPTTRETTVIKKLFQNPNKAPPTNAVTLPGIGATMICNVCSRKKIMGAVGPKLSTKACICSMEEKICFNSLKLSTRCITKIMGIPAKARVTATKMIFRSFPFFVLLLLFYPSH